MNKLEIKLNSLQVSKNGVVISLFPLKMCVIKAKALNYTVPKIEIYNIYKGDSEVLYDETLDETMDATDTVFTTTTILQFAIDNFK